MTNETAILDDVLSATSLMDLDGATGKVANRVYLMYARKVHPDMFQDEDAKVKAQAAFTHLSALKDRSEGKPDPSVSPAKQRASKNMIKTKKHVYELKRVFHTNDTFTKYMATYDDGHENALLSILNDPQDSDLADAHVAAFEAFKDVPEDFRMYYPVKIEDFKFRDDQTGEERRIVSTKSAEGFRTMADIFDEYPQGIGGRDIAWIFRRMLVAVGNAHDVGLVNGAPNVDAFMIHDAMHGIILTDWQYSVPVGQPLKAIPSLYESIYPEYALEGEPVDDRLDIHIIATMAERLLGDYEPRQLFSFFAGCKLASVPSAPQLLAEFDELLDRLYGKRKFHEFKLGRKGV